MSEAGRPTPNRQDLHRQQLLYWKQVVELKELSIFIRHYRDQQAQWVKWIGIAKGVAASSTIPGWVLFQKYDYVWGVIVGASQLADAVKEAIPHAKRHKAAAEFAVVLERMFIDAQFEWESVFAGKFPDAEIRTRRRVLARRQLDAERAHFPGGIASDTRLTELAESEAKDYFLNTYGVGGKIERSDADGH